MNFHFPTLSTRFILVFFFSLSIIAVRAQTATINSIEDSYAAIATPDDNLNEDVLRIKHSLSGSAERNAWIKFSTDNMPGNSEQVLLRLIKTGGDRGNIKLRSTINESYSTITWNNQPTVSPEIEFGGWKIGDTCFFDVTKFVNDKVNTSVNSFTFQVYSTSIITSTIKFASAEAAGNIGPQLLFYDHPLMEIPIFGFDEVTIQTSTKGNYEREILVNADTPETRNVYGGWEAAEYSSATGFFHVTKDCSGAWHIIDPLGQLFYSAGINSIEKGGSVALPQDLNHIGLNTMGNWSDESIPNIAYCPRLNFLLGFKNTDDDLKTLFAQNIMPVFDPRFPAFCQNLAQSELPPYQNDPWVLGFFLDNELNFHKDQLLASLNLDTDNAQYIAADNWLKAKYGNDYELSNITSNDEEDYKGYVAGTYYQITHDAVKNIDANHMILGTRFHSSVKTSAPIFSAAASYTDIISVNYYGRIEPEEDVMDMWMNVADKPFMITEFYVKGTDAGLSNEDGAGWEVPTQTDRANWFSNWMLKLLSSRGNVGFHWFRYIDNHDANKGLYNESYLAYPELQAVMSSISNSIYGLRSLQLYGNSNYEGRINCFNELCGNIAGCELVTNSSTNSQELKTSIFPNPTTSFVTITHHEGMQIQLINSYGIVVSTEFIDTKNYVLDMRSLAKGTYTLRLSNDLTTSTNRIIKF